MKRALFLLALTLMITGVRAESGLVVQPMSGSEQVIALSRIGRMVARQDYVYFYAKDKTLLAKYETSEIRRITFAAPTDDVQVAAEVVRVFPNPALAALVVSGGGGEMLRVYSLKGELVMTCPVTGTETTVNVEGLSAGTYILVTGINHVTKFIKK